MHAFRTILASFSLLLLPLPGAFASPTLLPRLHAPHEFRHEHRHSHTLEMAAAAPTPEPAAPGPERRNPVGDCNVAGQHCCNTTTPQSSDSGAALTGLLGLSTLPGTSLLMGLGCSPLAPILSAGGTCTGTMVCCSGDQTYNGLVNMGCSPLEL